MKKIPPSERIRKRIWEIREGTKEGWVGEREERKKVLDELVKEGARLIMQEMLEEEVEEFLERGYYERKGNGRGYRNGYESLKVKTPLGKIEVATPQVRDTEEKFESKVRKFLKENSDVLEGLAVEMYARGMSTRDIEEALEEISGDRVLSRSTVSRISEKLWEEFKEFQEEDLSKYEIVYLFLDAVYESLRKRFRIKEGVLVAWGIDIKGRKILLGIWLGNKESYQNWLEALRDLIKRGMNVPVSVTSDGAPGLIKAIEAVFPKSLRIRCWRHKLENLSHKVPEEVWLQMREEIKSIRDAVFYEEGERKLKEIVEKYKDIYPSLVKSLLEDHLALLNVLKLPLRHRKAVRTTNLVERSFEEERRRTKVIGGFLTEKSALKVVFTTLIKAERRWRKIPMGEREIAQIKRLRKALGIEEWREKKEMEVVNA